LLFGLGWPQWLTIAALIVGLILTFKVMARASLAYEKARRAREEDQQPRWAAEGKLSEEREK
jgi:flagellar biosynthesis/type III secretory pathway M-ring protein FliF/YscJ